MGFTDDEQAGILILQPDSLPRVYDVAVDILFAQEETVIMRKVQSQLQKVQLHLSDVLFGRRQVDSDTSDFPHTINKALESRNRGQFAKHTVDRMAAISTNRDESTGRLEAGKEHGILKLDHLALSPQDDLRSPGLRSPIRSFSVGSTPVKALSTAEFEDMISNLPAVVHVPSMKRANPGASHIGQSHDDSDVPSLSSSFVARHAVLGEEHDIYEQQVSNGAMTGQQYYMYDQSGAGVTQDEEQPMDDANLYGSGGEHDDDDDDSADLKSLVNRSKMHESNLSMVEQSGYYSPLEDRYQRLSQEEMRMNQLLADQYYDQPDQKVEGKANIYINREQIGRTDCISEPHTPDDHLLAAGNRQIIGDQGQHNSAPPGGAHETAAESAMKQLHSDVIPKLLLPLQPEVPPRSSSKIAVQRNRRVFKEAGQECSVEDVASPGRAGIFETGAVSRQFPPLQPEVSSPTSSKVAVQRNLQEFEETEQQYLNKHDKVKSASSEGSESFVTYSLDMKKGMVKEGTCTVTNHGCVCTDGEEFEIVVDSGQVQRDCDDKSTAVSSQSGHNIPDMDDKKPAEIKKEKLHNRGEKRVRGYPETDPAATCSTVRDEKCSYASVAAIPPRTESFGKKHGPGVAQRQSTMSWQCQFCTFVNCCDSTVCEVCNKTRDFQLEASPNDNTKKQCKFCTLLNPVEVKMCKACNQPFDLSNLPLMKEMGIEDIVDLRSTVV